MKQWAEADIMGVSLKKLGNNPQFHVYNLGKDKISFKFRGIKPPKSPLSSKDMYITAGAPGDINIQIRTFDYNSDIQCEIKGKNAAGGKAGFGITSFMMKEFAGTTVLGKAEIAKLDEPTKLKKISEGYKAAGFSYSVEVLKAELQKKEFVDKQKKYQQKIRDDFFVSKIQSTQIAGAIKKMADKDEGDILIGVLFSYAHSLGLKDVFKASVYGKVY